MRWMSPEILALEHSGLKSGRPTKQCDCYALGMVICEVLSGQAPFSQFNRYIVMHGRKGRKEWRGCCLQMIYGGCSIGAGKFGQKVGLVLRRCSSAWSGFRGIRSHPLCRRTRMIRILQVILPESLIFVALLHYCVGLCVRTMGSSPFKCGQTEP